VVLRLGECLGRAVDTNRDSGTTVTDADLVRFLDAQSVVYDQAAFGSNFVPGCGCTALRLGPCESVVIRTSRTILPMTINLSRKMINRYNRLTVEWKLD
jgi:hypothetical protein